MTNFYIAAAWVTTFVIVGGYALSIVIRGRRLTQLVPVEQRRWMADRTRAEDPLSVMAAAEPNGGRDV